MAMTLIIGIVSTVVGVVLVDGCGWSERGVSRKGVAGRRRSGVIGE